MTPGRWTIDYIVKRNVRPKALGVPTGPFSDEDVANIVATIKANKEDKKEAKAGFVKWLLSVPLLGKLVGLFLGSS